MPKLQSTLTEPQVPLDERRFPAPPPGSEGWRKRKERGLCQLAATLRRFGPTIPPKDSKRSLTGILTYHHVARQVASDPYLLNVTPDRFRQQMTGLLQLGYQPCALRDLVGKHQADQTLPEKCFVVVFDDGHHSVYEHAWPVLRELDVPATIFLATGYLDRDAPLPFDACQTSLTRCGDTRRPLSTVECQELLAGGLIDLGSHTHAHQDFCGQPAAFSEDLATSLQLLGERFGLDQVTFSFPYGRYDPEMQQILEDHELLCGLTAECQGVTLNGQGDPSDRFRWGRFGATQFDTPVTLAAKLDGWYTWIQQHWHKLRGK